MSPVGPGRAALCWGVDAAECLPGARGPGDASLAAGSRPVSPVLLCLSAAPGAGRFAGSSGAPPPCPARIPWAPAAAVSWMLPDCTLGRPRGPPLWDPACCCPRVSVSSWGGSVPPRASICDRSTLSGSARRRRGGQGCPRLGATLGQVERNRDSVLGSLLCPRLERGARRGRVSGASLELELQAAPARQRGSLGSCPSPGPSRKVCPGLLSPDLLGAPDPLPEGTGRCVALESPPADLTTSD